MYSQSCKDFTFFSFALSSRLPTKGEVFYLGIAGKGASIRYLRIPNIIDYSPQKPAGAPFLLSLFAEQQNYTY